MVIQHLIAPAPFGGAESVVLALATGHRRRGHDVSVVVVVHGEDSGDFARTLRAARVPVFAIRVPPRGYLRERRRLASMLRAFEPDVVHTHGYRADVLDGPVVREAGIPVVSTVHGFTGGDFKNRLYQWLQRRSLAYFDGVVAVSRPLAEELRASGIPAEKVVTIPNGAPPPARPMPPKAARRMLGVPEEGFLAGWVGRLTPEKGPDVFIEALARPELRTSGVSASVIGDGPLRGRLEARATELGIPRSVRWHGAVPGAARLFRAFDVLVLSSRTEGTPVVVLEALAAGVPVVASAVGGVPDAVAGARARLVPPDDPRALAQALAEAAAGRIGIYAPRRSAASKGPTSGRGWLEAYEELYARVTSHAGALPDPAPTRPETPKIPKTSKMRTRRPDR